MNRALTLEGQYKVETEVRDDGEEYVSVESFTLAFRTKPELTDFICQLNEALAFWEKHGAYWNEKV